MASKKPTPPPALVSEQVRAVIVARALTPYAVSQAAGVEPSVVTRFLKRERSLSLDSFEKICRGLGLKLTEGGGGLR